MLSELKLDAYDSSVNQNWAEARDMALRMGRFQAELNAKGLGDPRDAEIERLKAKLAEVEAIVGQGIPDGAAAQWSAWYRLMEICDVDPFKNLPGPPHG